MNSLKFLSLVTLCILISKNVFSEKVYMKYGKISENEIAMNVCPIDSNASAVVLGAIGRTNFKITQSDITIVFEKHIRIKVFDKEAFDKGNFKIYLYKGQNGKSEKITNIKGSVFNMTDGKLQKSKLSNDNVFRKELNTNHDVVNVSFPNITEGSIIDLDYQIESPFLFNFQPWRFQDDIPTLHSEYNVEIIEWFNYKNWMEGYIPIKRTETDRTETFKYTISPHMNANMGGGITSAKQVDLKPMVKYIKYLATNVPAFKNEPFITTPSDYLSSVQFELQTIKYPNSILKNYTSTWDKINETLLKDSNFGFALKADGHLKDIANTINSIASTPEQKARLAYEHISQKMAWNKSFRVETTSTLRKAYKENSGSSADINLNLVALCRLLGLDANPVIVSTRTHGMIRPGLVSLTQFNHVITAANINGQYILMDATDNSCPYNLLPSYSLNGKGRMVIPGLGCWIDLYSKTAKNESFYLNLTMDENLNLTGDLAYKGRNYAAVETRNEYKQDDSEDKFISNIEKKLSDADVSEFSIENVDSINNPIIIKSKVVLKDRISQAGDMLFLNPKVINRTIENIFKREERTYPVDYNYPIKEMVVVTITFPDNYEIDEIPQPKIASLPENEAKYIFSINKMGENSIQFTNRYQINKTIFSGMEYPNLRKFNEIIVAKEAELVVLKKIN